MTELNTLQVTFDKLDYRKGETIKVKLTGNVTRTSDVSLTNLSATASLSDGSKINIVLPATVIKDGQVNVLTARLDQITDPSGRVWLIDPDGMGATAIA
jgi:uncharacterized protein YfaS (alpha-2-macroglobulin family)